MGAGKDSTAGRTPLIHAVLVGRPELVDLLLAHGARLEVGDDADHTPLMYAVLAGKLDMARHLVRAGARLDAKDKNEASAENYLKDGDDATAKWLAESTRHHAELLAAVHANDLPRAWQAVEAGASPNTNDGKTSLLMAAVAAGDLALVKKALGGGCRADLLHMGSFVIETPLGLAAAKGSLELLRLLLAAGTPNRFAVDDALACAAGSELADRAERVKLLLAAGADAGVETLLQTPLANAARRGDLPTMALLLGAGAGQAAVDHALGSACALADETQALAVVRALLAIGADANYDYLFTTPLGDAAQQGHLQVLALMAPKATDATLSSAVAQAARAGNVAGLKWLCEHGGKRIDFAFKPGLYATSLNAAIEKEAYDCLEVLIAAGADVNHQPEGLDSSPLLAAVGKKDGKAIALLLAAGADPLKVSNRGLFGTQSALGRARQDGDDEIIAMLEKGAAKGRDPLGATLLATGLVYTDGDRFYDLRFSDSDKKRAQVVHIRKAVDQYESLRVQEVFSLCYDASDPPGEELLRTTFQKRFGIGGLQLEAPSEQQSHWRIRYRIAVACDTSAEGLAKLLRIAQATADQLEKELNPGAEDRL